MFKKIQFTRIKDVADYILRKLQEGNVILGIYVSENEVTCVDSYWLTNESNIHKYTLYPILDDNDGTTFKDGAFIDIKSEEDDCLTYNELKSCFRYKPIAYINAVNMNEDHHQHWFYVEDKTNVWGPLETNLIKHFICLHPHVKVFSKSRERQKDFLKNKSKALEYGFSNEIAEYMVVNLPGFFRDLNDLHKWIGYLSKELGEDFAEILNKSFCSKDSMLFHQYFNVENIERALGFRK